MGSPEGIAQQMQMPGGWNGLGFFKERAGRCGWSLEVKEESGGGPRVGSKKGQLLKLNSPVIQRFHS